MDADDLAIETVLSEGRRFMVPLYQRKYQWGDERLTPFWEDVEAKAVEVLNGVGKFQHYLGALILAPLGNNSLIGTTPRVQVVDGQQRLTTFQLFLSALREVSLSHGIDDLAEQVNVYLFNQLRPKDTDPTAKFKLTPTPSDRRMFHDIVELDYESLRTKYSRFLWGGGVPKNTPWRSLRAYHCFRERIAKFAEYGPSDEELDVDGPDVGGGDADTSESVEARLEALFRALLERMKLVVITLDEGDDAQVIFETLNSKGEPLLAMDLVRNNIFHRAEQQSSSSEELYKELWDPFDAPWWRENAPNARPRRPRIDHFLAHVLAAESGQGVSLRELYAEYRAYAVPKGKPRFADVRDELKVLERCRPLYESLEGVDNGIKLLEWLGRKLAAWQVTTAYPVAMQIESSSLPVDEKNKIAKAVYSYIVRRTASDLTTKNLNKVFQSLSQKFFASGVSYSALREFFSARAGDSSRFPADGEFVSGLLSNPLYDLAHGERVKDILWELETACRPKFSEQMTRPPGLWTEHVMPVSWDDSWPFQDAVKRARYSLFDENVQRRNRIVHSLGNLTLLTSGLNISSSNHSFGDKCAKYDEHTSLYLNRWFQTKKQWTESDIVERARHLSTYALKIWPGLDQK